MTGDVAAGIDALAAVETEYEQMRHLLRTRRLAAVLGLCLVAVSSPADCQTTAALRVTVTVLGSCSFAAAPGSDSVAITCNRGPGAGQLLALADAGSLQVLPVSCAGPTASGRRDAAPLRESTTLPSKETGPATRTVTVLF
jgi:hypothetical protein